MDTKEEIQKEYDELMVKMDLLEKEAANPSDSERAELSAKRDELREKWEVIKDTSGDAWEEVKDGFKMSLEELKEGYREITGE